MTPDDPINIQFTSGTTGAPKGATLTHHNILNNGYFVGLGMALTSSDRLCLPVPLYHCFGMVMGVLACVTHGAAMVFPGETFDPETALAAVAEERCTALYGVPTMFVAILAHPRFDSFDLTSLRTGVMAGASCPVETMRCVIGRMHMRDVTICYGMTETSPVSFQTRIGSDLETRIATVGTILPYLEAKLVDAEGCIVPLGETGEVLVRGYSVMRGYWDQAAATAAAIDEAGWMHSGDLAVLGTDCTCRIVGRIKDMIIRGGENIYPAEIENFLMGHPDIVEVAVFGMPHAHWGEEVVAWLRANSRDLDRGAPRILPRADRALQDPDQGPPRGNIPDDGLGQDPEIRDAQRHGARNGGGGMKIKAIGAALLGSAGMLAWAPPAMARTKAEDGAARCAALARLVLPDTIVASATYVAAGPYTGPDADAGGVKVEMPAHCRVIGKIRPAPRSNIGFEVWLPAAGWNGKFQGAGNGGFAGDITYRGGLVEGVARGYAVASTDTGHAATGLTADWAVGNVDAQIDYGHRGIHMTAVTAKKIVAAYYGRKPRLSIFSSCSNGGRQALMEAQRFPGDYDGIIAGAPAYDWTRLAQIFLWNGQSLTRTSGSLILPGKLAAIQAAILAQCDGLDGLKDGLVRDPRKCGFKASSLVCKGVEDNQCLTPDQAEALDRIHQGPPQHARAPNRLFGRRCRGVPRRLGALDIQPQSEDDRSRCLRPRHAPLFRQHAQRDFREL